jgi:hypothetical protein
MIIVVLIIILSLMRLVLYLATAVSTSATQMKFNKFNSPRPGFQGWWQIKCSPKASLSDHPALNISAEK